MPLEDPTPTPESPSDRSLGEPGDDYSGMSPGASEGESPLQTSAREELPEEYKPYSQFPWTDIPEDVRPDVLSSVKKFHGDMTRKSQEAAELRKEIPELRQKADFLDRLAGDPAFMDWYNRRYNGQAAGGGTAAADAPNTPGYQRGHAVPGGYEKLKELMDTDALTELGQLIAGEVQRAVGPLSQGLDGINRRFVADRTEQEINTLREEVEKNEWPSLTPDLINRMTDLVYRRRAANVRDAYTLVCHDDLIQAEVKKALQRRQGDLERKAEVTFPPRAGPTNQPGEDVTFGSNTLELVNEAAAELRRQGLPVE